MRTLHHSHSLGRQQLQAMAAGQAQTTIDDMEFLETLARCRCLVMPPWVYHIGPGGKLERLTPVKYAPDYNLDKAAILLAVMRKLPKVH